MTIQPTYVTPEQAEQFKDKGWKEWCKYRYTDFEGYIELTEDASDIFPYAPEHWQVCEWLRVRHGIWIIINPDLENNRCFFQIVSIKYKGDADSDFFNSPQEAYSAAFDYILANLLKK